MNILDIIRVPIAWLLNGCYKLVPNYVIALLLFTFAMKLILFPLGIKQQKNSVKQAKLRPKELAIRKRYEGRTDQVAQQKMTADIQKLYQDENFSPFSGCLPMILQLVIVFALYAVVMSPLHYVCKVSNDNIKNIYKEAAVLYKDGVITEADLPEDVNKLISGLADKIKVNDDGSYDTDSVKASGYDINLVNFLRAVDKKEGNLNYFIGENMLEEGFTGKDLPSFTVIGDKVDLSKTPSLKSFGWLWLIPLLTFVGTFGSMKLTRKFTYQPPTSGGRDAMASMKIMDFSMPLISTFLTFSVPAVVAVYWIYQNLFGTLQQFVLSRMYKFPTFTEEELRAAEKEMNKGVRQSKKTDRAPKSGHAAHRIDLEEPEAPGKAEEDTPAPAAGKGSDLVPPAALKDDSDRHGKK